MPYRASPSLRESAMASAPVSGFDATGLFADFGCRGTCPSSPSSSREAGRRRNLTFGDDEDTGFGGNAPSAKYQEPTSFRNNGIALKLDT